MTIYTMKPSSLLKLSKFVVTCLCCLLALTGQAPAAEKQAGAINTFIDKMVAEHQFDADNLKQLFDQVEIKDNILKAISRPAEGFPWYRYRKIFLTDSRINGGVKFWQDNQTALQAVSQQYGVPEQIIVAIIGVETRYGEHTGNYRVIDALSTLGFNYPKRSKFFLRELEKFLLLCRTEQMDPLQPTGSYAGAMGIPQFMPSSYLAYSADHDNDGKRDIWGNNGDVFASIANYFIKHKWQAGLAVAYPIQYQDESYKQALTEGLKPDATIGQLQNLGLTLPGQLPTDTEVKLLEFETETGAELWLGLANFYSITRYNHSALYALAVFQLSQAIADKREL